MEWRESAGTTRIDVGEVQRVFLAKVYRWMCLGLGTTAFVAYAIATNPVLARPLLASSGLRLVLWLGELALVVVLAAAAPRLSAGTAGALFFFYAALNGASFSALFFMYHLGSVAEAFLLTAGAFGVMSVYGTVTQKDLSGWRSFLFMGLIGIVLASVFNFFIGSTATSFVISCASVLIFTGLTAYDTQKLRVLAVQLEGNAATGSLSVVGALTLYLDFVNLFLALLRLTGRRR